MAESMLLAFGRYLKLVRERRKLSLEDVATLTKSYPEPINKGYLSRVERGLARIGFSKMVALSRAYEVPLDAFGEKLALDLEVDELRDAPDTRGKTFGELYEEAKLLSERGRRLHGYACLRDALPRAATDPLVPNYGSLAEQVSAAAMNHAVAAGNLGRVHLALQECEFVRGLDALGAELAPVLEQQFAVAHRRLGNTVLARAHAERAIDLGLQAPTRRFLGDAYTGRARLANADGERNRAIELYKLAFAAFKHAGRLEECARALTNLAQVYFEAGRARAARRALGAAERLADRIGAFAVKSRTRILLAELEIKDGNLDAASALLHEAIDVAKSVNDTSAAFKAEFQLFKLALRRENRTAASAFGRRLHRMSPWISQTEPELAEFRELWKQHRPPKQRSVAKPQHG